MLKEFYTAAMGMMTQQTRLEVASNNMANAATSGFRRQEVFVRNLIDARANFYNVKGDAEQNDVPVGSYSDFELGAMQQTDNPLDIAILDKGNFFMLQDEEGKQFLSRSGRFMIDKEGTIRAMDGKYLLGQNGKINLSSEQFAKTQQFDDNKDVNLRVTENGEIFVNDFPVDSLLIANPDDPQTLQRVSGSSFIPTNITELRYLEPTEINVQQGFIEASNVNVVNEMVEMIELQRHFEAGQKVVTTNDSTLDSAIRLGRFV
jgi:flagellar basal-body rod protein FlgG